MTHGGSPPAQQASGWGRMVAGSPRMRVWMGLLLALVFCAWCIVGWIMIREPVRALSDDGVEYLSLARNLAVEHRFVSHYHPGEPELYRTPVYPAMLAILGAWKSLALLRLAMVLQLIMGLATAIGIGLAARMQGARNPWVAGALYLASPIVLAYTPAIGTEPAFLLFVAYSAYLLVRGLRRSSTVALVGSGLLMGAATLARPIGIVLCVAGLLLLITTIRRPLSRRRILIWTLSAFLLPAAWTVRNGTQAGFWGVSRTTFSYPSSVLGSQYLENGTEPMKTSAYDTGGVGTGIADMGRAIARNPFRAAKAIAIGTGRTLLGPGEWTLRRMLLGETGYRDSGEAASVYSIEASDAGLRFARTAATASPRGRSSGCLLIMTWSIVSLLVVYIVGVAGTIRIVRRKDGLGAVWLIAALLLTLASAGFVSNSRFRLPIVPFILLAGARPRDTASDRVNGN
jgi:4-amino-4-deoxy-L-arabinose transferase-like glycosyltransferase